MKTIKLYKSALTVIAALSIGSMTIGCSDWNDHYDADTKVSAQGKVSLLQNLRNNSELSQFVELLDKSEFASRLDTTQVYTVWAPKNGTFDYETLKNENNSTLRKEFIHNHVARYIHRAKGTLLESVRMLNDKVYPFTGIVGDYKFDYRSLLEENIPSSNGLIHVISGKADFYPSIDEYLDKRDYEIDSIAQYFRKYKVATIDESASLQGPTVDGKITYLDTVFTYYNKIYLYYLNADLAAEDSSYTMVLLNNKAWNAAREKLNSYFQYTPSFTFTDPINKDNTQKVDVDVEYLRDSMINYNLVRDLAYNNNFFDNKKLLTAGRTNNYNDINVDSLISTSSAYSPLSTPSRRLYTEDAKDFFYGANAVEMSNGYVWVTDSFRMKPWNSWARILTSHSVAGVKLGTLNYSATSSINPATEFVLPEGTSSLFYYSVKPTSSSSSPEIDFFLHGVLSTTYDIYGVFVPANISNVNATNLRPNCVSVTLGYNNEKGQTRTQQLGDGEKFVSDSSHVSVLYFGTFEFPICYVGTGSYYPYLRVRSSFNTSSESDLYDNEIRMAGVILVPKELEDYIQENPDYKFGDNSSYEYIRNYCNNK